MPDALANSPAEELATLERKLTKRRDVPGFATNARAIEARIAELRAEIAAAEEQVTHDQPSGPPE